MPPKEENTGLLSKVVKFVKSPTSNWNDAEGDTDRESSYSKQMLKEMIERKRRNDFVRKREFDMLRKMRRSDVMAGQDHSTRPSFFQNSMISRSDDRAVTLKKIDDIEAQMSMQWWKTNHSDGPGRTGTTGQAPLAPAAGELNGSRDPTVAAELASMLEFEFSGGQGDDAAPIVPDVSQSGLAELLGAATVIGSNPSDAVAPDSANSGGFGFEGFGRRSGSGGLAALIAEQPETPRSGSMPLATAAGGEAIEVAEEFTHDPELEEASIRFANGDDAGAEAGLLEVLAPGGARIDHDETWLALFDLYRATGEHERFETAALDFAERFGRSAPQWVSFPEAVGRMNLPAKPPASGAAVADWTCPVNMGLQTVAVMNAALARSPRPWRVSWAKLNAIDRAAVDGLKKAFTAWGSQPQPLHFLAPEKLEHFLSKATPSGDASVDPAWWQLRMEMLRLMHRPDEFEMVALDYCVTYEVSPPSWEKTACKFKALQADGNPISTPTIIGEAFHDSVPASGLMEMGRASTVCTVELAGEILGDAGEALAMLDARLGDAESIVISCARLIRIDFGAAGMVLNWVAAHGAQGRHVQFVEVHRLVAAFFNVIAISEHSRVVVRAH
jgi:ABC-type transporter Mla MlaB component